jgi:hypothetical protein
MNIFRLSGTGAAVASVMLLTACSTSTPMVGSERATTQDLLADLQSVGLCLGDVRFSTVESDIGRIANEQFALCFDGLEVSFFEPSDAKTITTLFQPMMCLDGVQSFNVRPVVWGLNWVVYGVGEESQAGLEALSEATLGNFTDTSTMYAEFCKALNG